MTSATQFPNGVSNGAAANAFPSAQFPVMNVPGQAFANSPGIFSPQAGSRFSLVNIPWAGIVSGRGAGGGGTVNLFGAGLRLPTRSAEHIGPSDAALPGRVATAGRTGFFGGAVGFLLDNLVGILTFPFALFAPSAVPWGTGGGGRREDVSAKVGAGRSFIEQGAPPNSREVKEVLDLVAIVLLNGEPHSQEVREIWRLVGAISEKYASELGESLADIIRILHQVTVEDGKNIVESSPDSPDISSTVRIVRAYVEAEEEKPAEEVLASYRSMIQDWTARDIQFSQEVIEMWRLACAIADRSDSELVRTLSRIMYSLVEGPVPREPNADVSIQDRILDLSRGLNDVGRRRVVASLDAVDRYWDKESSPEERQAVRTRAYDVVYRLVLLERTSKVPLQKLSDMLSILGLSEDRDIPAIFSGYVGEDYAAMLEAIQDISGRTQGLPGPLDKIATLHLADEIHSSHPNVRRLAMAVLKMGAGLLNGIEGRDYISRLGTVIEEELSTYLKADGIMTLIVLLEATKRTGDEVRAIFKRHRILGVIAGMLQGNEIGQINEAVDLIEVARKHLASGEAGGLITAIFESKAIRAAGPQSGLADVAYRTMAVLMEKLDEDDQRELGRSEALYRFVSRMLKKHPPSDSPFWDALIAYSRIVEYPFLGKLREVLNQMKEGAGAETLDDVSAALGRLDAKEEDDVNEARERDYKAAVEIARGTRRFALEGKADETKTGYLEAVKRMFRYKGDCRPLLRAMAEMFASRRILDAYWIHYKYVGRRNIPEVAASHRDAGMALLAVGANDKAAEYLDIAARFEDGEDVYRAPKPTAADVDGLPDFDLPVIPRHKKPARAAKSGDELLAEGRYADAASEYRRASDGYLELYTGEEAGIESLLKVVEILQKLGEALSKAAGQGQARMDDAIEAYEDARELARDIGDGRTVEKMDRVIAGLREELK